MNILAQKLSVGEFKEYVDKFNFGSIPPDKIVLHHTWKPTREDWKGAVTLYGIKSYYERLGWKSGPHIFIADDGIWLFTSMYDVGTHAGKGNSTRSKWGRLTGYSLGIEVVGNYDTERWEGKTKHNTFAALKFLTKRLKLRNDDILFHSEFSAKTCPGSAIKKDWIFRELERYDEEGLYRPPVSERKPSVWAKEAWDWAKKNHLCDTTDPQEKVTAEFLITMLYNSLRK